MGFIYDKNKETDKKSQMKIGILVTFAKIQALKEAGFTLKKTSEILGISESIVKRHWNRCPEI